MATTVHQTVGALATQAIGTYLEKAERYEKPVLADRDPEDLHHMRVNLRRLRTVMQVFAPGIILPKAGREPQVAAIARSLGQLRDADVIRAALQESYGPDLPTPERNRLKSVFRDLKKQRKKQYKRTKSLINSKRYRALKASLHRWVLQPDCTLTARLAMNVVLPDLTLPLVSQLWLHPGWLVATNAATGQFQPDEGLSLEAIDRVIVDYGSSLHGLRKQVKRVRYQLTVVSEFYGDRLETVIQQLADLQGTLGALQDTLTLAEFLHQTLPKWESQLPTLKALLANHRTHIWQQWQVAQQSYLDTSQRQALRQILMQPSAAISTDSSALNTDPMPPAGSPSPGLESS